MITIVKNGTIHVIQLYICMQCCHLLTVLLNFGSLYRQQWTTVTVGMLLLDFSQLSPITVHTSPKYQGCYHKVHVPDFTRIPHQISALSIYSLQDMVIIEESSGDSSKTAQLPSKYNYIIIFFNFTETGLHYVSTVRIC